MRREWTEAEREFARGHKGRMTAAEIAQHLGRTERSVSMHFATYGLTTKRIHRGRAFERFIRSKHRLGWSDRDTAQEWNNLYPSKRVCRTYCGIVRRRLGLPSNKTSEHCRQKTAAKTKEQLRKAGLSTIGQLRATRFAEWCAEHGWPQVRRPRSAQILNLLYERGPQTRRQIASAIGMAWLGSRKSLKSSDPEGSYLAHLISLGLVVQLPKVATGGGRGSSQHLYAIAPNVRRITK